MPLSGALKVSVSWADGPAHESYPWAQKISQKLSAHAVGTLQGSVMAGVAHGPEYVSARPLFELCASLLESFARALLELC
jgi:hypothetical protein